MSSKEYCKILKEKINIAEFFKKLFSQHFRGLIFIDVKTELILKYSDEYAGKLNALVSFTDKTYDEQVIALIKKAVPASYVESLISSMKFSTVLKKLETEECYGVDFYSIENGEHKFNRISFAFADENKSFVALLSEDVSKISSGEIDSLTGGYNSNGFFSRVTEWIDKNPGKKYRMHRYDLDRFKDVNGVYGHELANKLLRDIAEYMKKYDNENSFSAHLNADHFARFCADEVMPVQTCYDNFIECFKNYNLSIPITMHMGVYDLYEEDKNPSTMAYKALLALQEIKNDVDKKIAFYEHGMMLKETERLKLLNEIDKAIENENFEVWFQPQVDYDKKIFFGAEALVRWRHPERGIIPPAEFIPLLEKSSYISKVDRYVIEKTCKLLREWLNVSPSQKIQISVNLSRQDVLTPDFLPDIERTIALYGIPHELLHFEITESAYIKKADVLNSAVSKLRKHGFSIELDDFGAGYSSLNTLKDMEVDKVKLDMKFLSRSKNAEKGEIIISAIIDMAHRLGLPVIAEGVETKAQADMLLSFGCKQMQGYYFSKPVPANDFENLVLNKNKIKNL